MADVTIKYKGQSIATMDASGSKTLGTQGKYCEGDIAVEYAKPAGPTGTKSISITENGTTTEDVAAYASAEITVDVQGGGGYTLEDIANGDITGDIVFTGSKIRAALFAEAKMTSFSAPNLTTITIFNGNSGSVFEKCAELLSVDLGNYSGNTYQRMFYGCTKLVSVRMEKVATIGTGCFGNNASTSPAISALALPNCTRLDAAAFNGNTKIKALDFSKSVTVGGSDSLRATNLDTIIYRGDTVSPLNNIANFNNTPFASGGTGGTIYIPKVLYDHLGDGTSLDYKSATNWSTIDGYGTITWAQIEGSIYETQYADGTPIT